MVKKALIFFLCFSFTAVSLAQATNNAISAGERTCQKTQVIAGKTVCADDNPQDLTLRQRELLAKEYPVTPLPSSTQQSEETTNAAGAFRMKLPALPKIPSFPTQVINPADTSDINIVKPPATTANRSTIYQ